MPCRHLGKHRASALFWALLIIGGKAGLAQDFKGGADGLGAVITNNSAALTPLAQTLIDAADAAGKVAAKDQELGWALSLRQGANYATDLSLWKNHDYWTLAQRSVDWVTVKTGGAIGALAMPEDPVVGKAIGSATTKTILDVGKFYVAPVIADGLIKVAPQWFIPPAAAPPIQVDPFTQKPIAFSTQVTPQAGSENRHEQDPRSGGISPPNANLQYQALQRANPPSNPTRQASIPQSVPAPTFIPPSGNTFSPPTPRAAAAPGGISLSRAAAEALAVKISLEGASYKDGKLLLAGRFDARSQLDGALLLTALRAACESQEPYFSLDPDDAAVWNLEGRLISEELWRHIKDDFGWDRKPELTRQPAAALTWKTILARRDYPRLWSELSPKFPNLRSRLVFSPEWLRQTRFGQILYRGDVLLKELAMGVPVLEDSNLPAATISGYEDANVRSVIRTLRSSLAGRSQPNGLDWQSSRLWFDLAAPKHDVSIFQTAQTPLPGPSSSRQLVEFEAAVKARGLPNNEWAGEPRERWASVNSDAIDVSEIFPKMFVRRTLNGRDIPGSNVDLDQLSRTLNRNIERYAQAYPELQLLTQIFRAYVVAVYIARNDDICERVAMVPLLESEKLTSPLPFYHASELAITVGAYEFSVPQGRRKLVGNAMSVNGGVSIGGKSFTADHVAFSETSITRTLSREASRATDESTWTSDGLLLLAFALDLPELKRQVAGLGAVAGETRSRGNQESEIENEPPPAPLPPSAAIGFNPGLLIVFLAGAIVLMAASRRRRA